ncbi:MAG: hypothetical protein Q8O00_16745, partial [Holophaga sp.]|nr:hypothetical protein [Holophaga sp.]
MNSVPSKSTLTRRALLGALGIAGLAGAGLLWTQRPSRWRESIIIHLLPQDAPAGFLPGLHWIAQSYLETLAPATVIRIPHPDWPFPTSQRAFQLQFRPSRQGDFLCLSFRWRRGGEAWHDVPGIPAPPAEAMTTFLNALPETFGSEPHGRLLPRSLDLSWELLNLPTIWTRLSSSPDFRPRLDRLIAQAPECALGWCLLGCAAYQEVVTKPDWIPEDRALAEHALNRALSLVPGLPFAAGDLSQMMSDFGKNGPAMEILAKAIRIHAHSGLLLKRIAYCARNAGLLDVAKAAALKHDRQTGHEGGVENTFLYIGDFKHFEAWILTAVQSRDAWSPPLRFYMGYSAMVQGNKNEALRRLREAGDNWSQARFGRMGFALMTLLEGRMEESLEALESLVQQHLALRAPDGEFILKLAE